MKTYNPYKLFRFCPIPNWLMQRPEVSFGAKCLFGQLTQHAGEDGFCFPSQKTLARELGCSVRHIKRLLAELKQHKLIATVRDQVHQSNSYIFLVHPWMSSAKEETRPVVEVEEPGDIAGDIAGDESVPYLGTDRSPIKDPIKQQTERRRGKSPGILEEIKQWEPEAVSFKDLKPEIKDLIAKTLAKCDAGGTYLNTAVGNITEEILSPTLKAKALAKHYLDEAERLGLWKREEKSQGATEAD